MTHFSHGITTEVPGRGAAPEATALSEALVDSQTGSTQLAWEAVATALNGARR